MRDDLKAEIVIDALGMATTMRRPEPGLIHHSDRGGQYRSLAFGKTLWDSGILASMGGVSGPLRQRGDRVDDGDDQEGVRAPAHVQDEGCRQVRDLPLHRGLLQPAPATFIDWELVSDGVRAETRRATASGRRVISGRYQRERGNSKPDVVFGDASASHWRHGNRWISHVRNRTFSAKLRVLESGRTEAPVEARYRLDSIQPHAPA